MTSLGDQVHATLDGWHLTGDERADVTEMLTAAFGWAASDPADAVHRFTSATLWLAGDLIAAGRPRHIAECLTDVALTVAAWHATDRLVEAELAVLDAEWLTVAEAAAT